MFKAKKDAQAQADDAGGKPAVDEAAAAPVCDAGATAAPDAAEAAAAAGTDTTEIDRLRGDIETLKDRLMRLQADFDNFRKRTHREKNDLYRQANQDLIAELLPVLDHFELAFGTVPAGAQPDPVVQGVRLVHGQLLTVLQKFGLTPLDAAGQAFDPTVHEAVSHLPSADVPDNSVIAQTRRGYMLADRLLRPAQVVVSRGAETETTDAALEASGSPKE